MATNDFYKNILVLMIPSVLGILSSKICPIVGKKKSEYERTFIEPPGYVFAIVWNIIYVLYGLFLVFGLRRRQFVKSNVYILFCILWWTNMLLNMSWTPIYACDRSLKNSKRSFWVIILLILTLLMLLSISMISYKSIGMTFCVLPYLTWLLVALLLNLEVVRKDSLT